MKPVRAGIGKVSTVSDFGNMWNAKGGKVKEMLRCLDVLIIDEVSMLSGEFLQYLEAEVARVRMGDLAHTSPFGGLQVRSRLPALGNRQAGT